MTPNSGARREQLVKQVSSGIINAQVQVVDVSATFEGSLKQEYVLTAAIANSPIDAKIQSALFVGRNSAKQGNEQINAVFKVNRPEISAMNFLELLKKDIRMTYEVDVKFGQNGNIHIQGNTDRTKWFTEQLQNLPLAKQAQQEIANGNLYQYASLEMLMWASAPNSLKSSVTYKNLNPVFMNTTYQVYQILKQLNWNTEVNPMKRLGDGKLQVEMETSYIDNILRFEMTSPYELVRVNNIPIPEFTPYLVSTYWPFSWNQRIMNYMTNYQYQRKYYRKDKHLMF